MKTREPRMAVFIPARLKIEGRWIDVRIRNLSSKGMLLEFGSPPPRGYYLEIARGRQRYTARVAWTEGRHCGVQTREPIDVSQLSGQHPSQRINETMAQPKEWKREALPTSLPRRSRTAEMLVVAGFVSVAVIGFGLPAYQRLADVLEETRHGLTGRMVPEVVAADSRP